MASADVCTAFLTIAAVALGPTGVVAQEPPDELTPRGIADSTYAVRVAIDGLAESFRRGQFNRQQGDNQELTPAVTRLAAAAARRTRPRPHRDLGILWDLQMGIAGFQAVAPDVLRVQVRVFLSTVGDSVSAQVTLTFRRRRDQWDLVAHEGLVERLTEMARQLPGGPGR